MASNGNGTKLKFNCNCLSGIWDINSNFLKSSNLKFKIRLQLYVWNMRYQWRSGRREFMVIEMPRVGKLLFHWALPENNLMITNISNPYIFAPFIWPKDFNVWVGKFFDQQIYLSIFSSVSTWIYQFVCQLSKKNRETPSI